jgi:hypothetical protein
MPEKPMLYCCHGEDGGPKIHPCRRVFEALREADIEFDHKVVAHGSPIPFLRKGSRDDLAAETGSKHLPQLRTPDGTWLQPTKRILEWIDAQRAVA